jgi:hypothetical protein
LKKVFSVILTLILLTGCTAQSNITPKTKGITFGCDVTYYNETYECKGETTEDGDTTIEFITPEDINGLRFEFGDKGVTANFKDTELKSQKIVFENSVASFICTVLNSENTDVINENDLFYTEGVAGDFEYQLQLGGTGLPLKITTRPDAVEVVFKNVKIK